MSTTLTPPTAQPAPPSPLRDFWRYFSANKGAVAGLAIVLGVMLLVAVQWGALPVAGDDDSASLVLPALASVTFTVYVTLDPEAAGAVTYQATVTPPAYLQDMNPGNDTASTTTQVTQPADVQVQLLAAPNPSLSGEAITLTATVRNVGPSLARGLRLTLQLPVGAQLHRPPSGPGWTCTAVAPPAPAAA